MNKRVKRYLVLITALTLAVFFLTSLFWIRDRFESSARQTLDHHLSATLYLHPQPGDPGDLTEFVQELAKALGGEVRVTVADLGGNILADSQGNAERMGNHLDREEFAAALESGYGRAVRASETTGVTTFYAAGDWGGQYLLRLGMPVAVTSAFVTNLLPGLLALIVLAAILASLFAARLTKRVTAPYDNMFAAIETALQRKDKVVEVKAEYEEMEPVVAYFHTVVGQISDYIGQITAKTEEIESITSAMEEGLVMLDEKLEIVMINRQASRMMGISADTWQKNITYLYRDETFVCALQKTRDSGRRTVTDLPGGDGKTLRVYCNPVPAGGYVLLISDVTELVQLERMRSDFAANVSHELKTPLTSVSGFAELIQRGLVTDPAQVREYAGKIHTESKRLVTLIDDILRLSSIESGLQEQEETVSLREIAEYAVQLLDAQIGERGLTVEREGDLTVTASRQRMTELVFNLADNAVKYNCQGGRIRIGLDGADGRLWVENTGEQIPLEHQSRIFERFYRVDTARSRRTGGTGLGLSIIKHIMEQYQGGVEVESAAGKTRFTASFPSGRVIRAPEMDTRKQA